MMFLASLAFAAWLAAAAPASAHSLEGLQSELFAREQFFQAVDRPAPAFTLQDPDGRTVRLGDLRGKVVALHFIYASCPDVCPLHADRIAEIQRMVDETPMRDLVQFVTITTDPARDTPDVLRDYGRAHGLDPANWTVLTSGPRQPEDTTRRLAEAFGHRFAVTADGYQMHGVVTHVIDQEGRLSANFHGLQFDPINLVVYVNALINDPRRPHGHGDRGLWGRIRGWFR
jgi:protein SCO1/2